MKTLYHTTLIVCLAIIAFAVLSAIYLSADGQYFNLPIQLKNSGEVFTTATTYHPNQTVFGTLIYCKSNSVQGVFGWELADTYLRFYQSQEAVLPTGCQDSVIVIEKIAPDAHAGTYHFVGEIDFRMNSLSTVSYPLFTNSFAVVTP